MSGSHARIAPSSLERTVICPGSVQMSEPHLNEPRTEEQLEGDAGHWVALQYQAGNLVPEGSKTPYGIDVTADMVHGANIWRSSLAHIPNGIAELPVTIPRIHASDCWGTPDFYGYTKPNDVLHVADYKFGHLYVEVFENWQLVAYACGIIDMLGINDLHTTLSLTIVQPRCYHKLGPVRTWTVRAYEIRAMVNVAFQAAELALRPNPPTKTSNQCTFCLARQECATLQRATESVLDFTGVMDRTPLTPDHIGRELTFVERAIELLEARRTGLSAQAESLIRSGKSVPFWHLEQSLGNLAWLVPPADVVALGQMYEKNLRKPDAVLTPTQAINAGIPEAIIKGAYADRPKKSLKLAPDNLTESKKVFAK